ncbi:lia operon protein LiaF [Paenibacillaceae bacterium GAS479]|nr:lia operon protein LiaF [Paenibacillaceae bacterium GAS479]
MNQGRLNQVLFGLAVVGAGALFLFHMAGIFGFEPLDIGGFVRQYWPLAPLFVGLSMLLNGGLIPGGIVTVFAVVMLARNTGYTDLSFGDVIRYLLPIVIILFGLRMIFARGERHRHRHNHEEWTSYNSDPDVPHAPPLHPDPLKKGEAGTKGLDYESVDRDHIDPSFQQHNREPYESASPSGTGDWKEELKHMKRDLKHGMKEMKKELKDASKSHRDEGGRGRTEWWNTDANVQNRSNFIGDIHLGHDYWDLVPLNISHFIGDTVVDLTRANISHGETRITISSFIGDVKVFLPADLDIGVQVVSSAFIGDSKVLERKEGGMFRHMDTTSPGYRDSERKIKLVCSTFIGDVRVTKVG